MRIEKHLAKLPDHLKASPEYKTLLNLVCREKITTATQFRRYLEAEIGASEKKLAELGNVPTNNRKRVELAKKLDFLKAVNEKVVRYL